ncbi:SAM and PH domain containing [Lecanosticta acicola]|uniref:SAM and PH domain containing n=1 Tax=Lecanosticta acicola TaxID=111012 RepID=A0AAI9E7V1_9PEZI|nr:SAM and PH domain containing [Lecanosticta acicola]
MPVITTLVSPLEVGGEMYLRPKTASSMFDSRPLSQMTETTEILETDFEDESDFDETSQKGSFESVSAPTHGAVRVQSERSDLLMAIKDDRRRSQTTISSYDEAPTPSPRTGSQRGQFELRFRPVEGPKGPHLFRSSQSSHVSAEFDFDHALQMSPLLPKEPPLRTGTAFTEDTVTPIPSQDNNSFSLDAALRPAGPAYYDTEAYIRSWSKQQVIDWMYDTGIEASVIQCFEVHDIDGTVLLDLQFEDLKELDIQSFGKRHQLWSAICLLRGDDTTISPQPTPFQDISRPCTSNNRRSPSRGPMSPVGDDHRPTSPGGGNKRRARKASKANDIVMPAESVSIVAIEQLLPKPHNCSKGERCAKWRKQQREIEQLHNEHGLGRFPVSPTKGGRIFVAGDPGNAHTAENMVPNVHKQQDTLLDDPFRPVSEAQPSIVASSDLLGPGQLPSFALQEDALGQLGSRDPQENVKRFLEFQHIKSPIGEDVPPSPPAEPRYEMFPTNSVSPFPAQYPTPSPVQPTRHTAGPHENLKSLPRLDIPRSASAGPNINRIASPKTAGSICRSATASPSQHNIYRLGTPASEMDVPAISAVVPQDPLARDTSQSVPPNMQFRPQQPLRSQSRLDWRRPSMALPAVKENEVFSPSSDNSSHKSRPSMSTSHSADSVSQVKPSVRDPSHHSPVGTKQFGYGPDCTHAGWMKKRQRTKMLRHEWQESHFRLKGTKLTQHANARLSSAAMESINVDDYAVACSTLHTNNKLSSAFKALHLVGGGGEAKKKEDADPTAFAFQLIPSKQAECSAAGSPSPKKPVSLNGKTHHFAVKTKDDRIEWMRELMIAKALQQKGKGYEVEVNGVQA